MKTKTALVLIGFQNDYFSSKGILNSVIEESTSALGVVENTVELINAIQNEVLIISTPIHFKKDYSELVNPVGILSTIKEVKAFQAGTIGAQTIPEIEQFGNKIHTIPGKQGLNAFINTNLEEILKKNGIQKILLSGCVTSICIDSTGRSAFDKGFDVTMISNCISGRSIFEHEFYLEQIFPLYASIKDSKSITNELSTPTISN